MTKAYYIDLDNDGFSEKIEIYRWENSSTAIEIFAHSGSLIDQYNFEGLYHFRFDLLHGDYNHNDREEIYFFTQTDDSLIHINQLELLNDTNYLEKRKFVTKIKLHNKKLDSRIFKIGMVDLNNDGFKEIIFHIFSGYSLQPRSIYAWNIHNDTVLATPKSYAKLFKPQIVDIDDDRISEIISGSHACGNTHEDMGTPYHDRSAWLMVYDNQLHLKYKPIEFKGYGTSIFTEYIKQNKKKYVILYELNFLNHKSYARLQLYDNQLVKIEEKKRKDASMRNRLEKVHTGNSDVILLKNDKLKQVEVIDFNLNAVKIYKPPSMNFYVNDVNSDGNDEIIYWNKNRDKLSIARGDFSHPVEYRIPESVGINYENYSVRLNGENAPQFSAQRGNKAYLLNYYQNPYYWLKYPFYFSLYAVFAILFYLVQKTQKKRIEQKYAQERELTKLQIQTIKNQTDPHFIFNALNSISSTIYREDKDTAYDFLNNFSVLIRAAIINSDKIQISLQEEIEFIENYLKLEKLRFKDKFDYTIDIDRQVDRKTNIPRMVMQSYIENAIKHGIMHAKNKCVLKITVKNENKHLNIIIEDNGIGREKAKEYAGFSTGKGLQIMSRIYELYDKLHQVKITQTIEDKKDKEGNALGTRVKVEIPIN